MKRIQRIGLELAALLLLLLGFARLLAPSHQAMSTPITLRPGESVKMQVVFHDGETAAFARLELRNSIDPSRELFTYRSMKEFWPLLSVRQGRCGETVHASDH